MKKDCPFKYKFESVDMTKCCLVLGLCCPGEDLCEMKEYREAQKKIWKKVGDKLVRR